MPILPTPRETDAIVAEVYEACARRTEAEPRRDYLGMSEIGRPCETALWLKYNGHPGNRIDGRLARIFAMGHVVEARVIEDLEAAGYPVDNRQLAFEDFDGRFRGHCDGVIHKVTREPHLLEVKSANDDGVKMFTRHGLAFRPAYEAQLHCYMGYSGLTRALFVVENKNNQELYMERVRFNPEIFEAMRGKAWRILNQTTKPLSTRTSECDNCAYNGVYCEIDR